MENKKPSHSIPLKNSNPLGQMKDKQSKHKGQLHPRNLHHDRYDLALLAKGSPDLAKHIITNQFGIVTINFANEESVKQLNKALLINYYKLTYWDLPQGYLCAPVPGRADYIHHLADLLNSVEKAENITCLDIGMGANCIYPIIGCATYGWNFVGTEIDEVAIKNAQTIVEKNDVLKNKISFRLQAGTSIFHNIILPGEYYAASICNPPFHASAEDAFNATTRKVNNLSRTNTNRPKLIKLNFGGQANELWTPGGEIAFITQMIKESNEYRTQVGWFTTLVSKEDSLVPLFNILKSVNITEVKMIEMSQGQKTSRFIAWRWKG